MHDRPGTPGMVLEQLQDGQHNVIHIAEAGGLQAWQTS